MTTLKTLLVAVGIAFSGMAMAQADDVPNTPKNQAFCGGVLKAVSVGQESYAPGLSRQHNKFSVERVARAMNRGLDENSVKHYYSEGFKKMRQYQAKDSDVAFELMQICLRLQ